jgi:hypothetical protein
MSNEIFARVGPMIRRTFLISLVGLLLSGCAPTLTPMQQELMSTPLPTYEGPLSPIQVPVRLVYAPVTMRLAGQFGWHTSLRDKDEIYSGELDGLLRVSPARDSLLWEFSLEKAVLGGEKVPSGSSPLMEFSALRDPLGSTKESGIRMVGMKADSPADKRSAEEIKAIVKSQFRSLSAELPAQPIQGGTLLLESDMRSVLQTFERLWGSPKCSPPKEKIGYAVRGVGFLKGRKVIVAVLEEDFICVSGNEKRYNLALHGYALLDAQTGQILENKTMTTIKSFYSFDSIELQLLQKVSGEIVK